MTGEPVHLCVTCEGKGLVPHTGRGSDGFDPCPHCQYVPRGRGMTDPQPTENQVFSHPFEDPISGAGCRLEIGMDVDRLRPGLLGMGVRHGLCPERADVSPGLDAFYCTACRWNGRISGAWAMDRLDAARAALGETPDA